MTAARMKSSSEMDRERYVNLAFLRGFFMDFAIQGSWQVRFVDIRDSSAERQNMSRCFVLGVCFDRLDEADVGLAGSEFAD